MSQEESVTIKAQPGAKDIFAYKIYHSFVSIAGLCRIIISLAFIVAGISTLGNVEPYLTIIVFVIGLLNVVVTPLIFLYQAIRLAKGISVVSYTFSSANIVLSDGEKRGELSWESVPLVVWLPSELFLYSSPYEAFVLPRRQMEDKDEEVLNIIVESKVKAVRIVGLFNA